MEKTSKLSKFHLKNYDVTVNKTLKQTKIFGNEHQRTNVRVNERMIYLQYLPATPIK